jgi:hypothetical protein
MQRQVQNTLKNRAHTPDIVDTSTVYQFRHHIGDVLKIEHGLSPLEDGRGGLHVFQHRISELLLLKPTHQSYYYLSLGLI